MLCVWKHIDRLNLAYFIFDTQQIDIARLCGRIATDVNNALRLGKQYRVNNILMHTNAWRIGNDNIRSAVLIDKILNKNIFHISDKKQRICNVIE